MIHVPTEPQVMAINHLRSRNEAALFMGCGLGKTASTLHALNDHFSDGGQAALVVAPLRVCNLTWPAEVKKWDQFRWMRVANLRTEEGWDRFQRGAADLYTCNYEMLPKLRKLKHLPFDTVVWDELTRAKNHASKRIRAVAKPFRARAKKHWGLTGTPAPNGLLDLFAQVRLLDGGARLGRSYDHFKKTYFHPTDYMEYDWQPNDGSRQEIYTRVQDLALTLKSSDWLDIPDVNQEDVDIVLPEDVLDQYNEMEKEMFLRLNADDVVVAQSAGVLVGKLLQLTSGAVYMQDKSWRRVHSVKEDALLELVTRLRKAGRPVMIFCQYRHEQERLRASMPYATFFEDADTGPRQQELAAKWNAKKIPALVANPQSIGHGLNMQEGGSDIIWYSLTYDRELYDQGIARVARMGQEQVTTIWRLMIKDSVDWAVASALSAKDGEQTSLLNALRDYQRMKEAA